MATILYALLEARPGNLRYGQPFYVGVGTLRRPYMHMKKARSKEGHYNLLMHAYLTDHLAEGVEPGVKIMGTFETFEEAAEAEREIIRKYGRIGRDTNGILCNLAHGGAGPDPELMKDPEVLARIAAASKARWQDKEFRRIRDAALKLAYSDPAILARVSEATIAALREPETRAKHLTALRRINAAMTSEQRKEAAAKRPSNRRKRHASVGGKAANKNPENNIKRSTASTEANNRTWADPEIRARRVIAMKGKKKTRTGISDAARRANSQKGQTPEANAKKSAASLARWADPEFRAAMAEKKRKAWQDPEARARMLAGRSEGIAKSWQDPAVRARRIGGIQAASVDSVEREGEHGGDSP